MSGICDGEGVRTAGSGEETALVVVGDGEDDEDMEDESLGEAGRRGLGAAFTEDEQVGELSIDEDYDMDTR